MDDTAPTLGLTLRVARADEWEQARDLRLEMLADTPVAYLATLADMQRRTDDEWREAHERVSAPNCFRAVVVDAEGRWRGQMSVMDDRPSDRAWLVAVYLAPDLRGTAAAGAMLGACADWTRTQRHRDALWLEVHESNDRAIRFYEKHDFVDTGVRVPYKLDPSTHEVEMRLDLA